MHILVFLARIMIWMCLIIVLLFLMSCKVQGKCPICGQCDSICWILSICYLDISMLVHFCANYSWTKMEKKLTLLIQMNLVKSTCNMHSRCYGPIFKSFQILMAHRTKKSWFLTFSWLNTIKSSMTHNKYETHNCTITWKMTSLNTYEHIM